MGKHSEWRKLAKKATRKRKRQAAALTRDKLEQEEQERRKHSPSYQTWLKEQAHLEEFQAAEESRLANEQERLYQEREKRAREKWEELQVKLQAAREARAAQNLKIKEEWEAEQKRLQALKDEKARQEEERLLAEQRLQQRIDEFIDNDGEMPAELNRTLETNPGKVACPFFARTGACRFGDVCSRNHVRPTVSNVLLVKNFYSHYSLDAKENEHGDSALEFDSHETRKHYEQFFEDVVPEFEAFGVIQQFRVCCNKEPHLRGNVYVGYVDCRQAMRSYKKFHGRFYAGRRLNVEFCTIGSWKAAICGLFYRKRCPKGSVCNFLHVFRNPGNLYTKFDVDKRDGTKSVSRRSKADDIDWNGSERSNWRWSSSPEVMVSESLREVSSREENSRRSVKRSSRRRSRSRSRSRSESIKKRKSRSRDRRKNRRRSKSSSRSSSRHKDRRKKSSY